MVGERNTPTVPMDDDLIKSIDDRLDYGDSRAAWIREACRMRLEDEGGSEDSAAEQPAN